MITDTTNTIIEHHMLREHPMYVAAIAAVVIVLFVFLTVIRKRKP